MAMQKLLQHPIWPIILGLGVAMDGPGNVLVRSSCLLICAVWLLYDFARYLWKRNKRWAPIFFAAASNLALVLVMLAMRSFLASKLEQQQANTSENISAQDFSSPSGELMDTMFMVRNGGTTAIGKHSIACVTNLTVGNSGSSYTANLESRRTTFNDLLLPNGDAQTDDCMPMISYGGTTDCADITVRFSYVLDTQPDLAHSKLFRFVGYGRDGRLFWVSQPVSARGSYCQQFLKRNK